MDILVTGGAGYIGSATVKRLIELGHSVVIIDNMSKGQERLIHLKAKFYQIDLIDKNDLKKVFSENRFDAVIHLAGYKAAGESMIKVKKYSQNIIGTINLLDYMTKFNVKKIIFSSSAAVYGEPQYNPVDEKHPTNPMNYYGFGKLECERIISWYSKLKGIIGVNLRYFNVIGDAGLNYIDPTPENILPIIEKVITGKKEKVIIFGNDYKTRDGTCIRDYIDINDLVEAHILALNLNENQTINLGTGEGITVLELIKQIEDERGIKINFEYGPRRKGDPAIVTASFEKAKKILRWKPSSNQS